MTGIYTITNLINHKIYVGFSNNINKRWNVHRNDLRKNKHSCYYLQQAWNKYGEESFLFEVLEECQKEYLCSQENYWTNILNSRDSQFGYNYKETNPDCKCKQSKETKDKISNKRIEWNNKHPHYNPFKDMSDFSKEKQYKNRKRRIINQYDLQGNLLNTFNSLSECNIVGFNNVSVMNCCKGKIKIYKGFVFRYEGEAFSIIKGKIKSKYE